MITIMELLMFTIVFMQMWDTCDTFGCCPLVTPCIAYKCKPCLPLLCPPSPPPPICPPPPPPCPPPQICPLPPPPVICPTLPPPCPPPILCPPPPPPVICPPLPPPCPPPPICPPPTICPPPIICPPPTLPPPPPSPFPPCPLPPPTPICPLPAPKVTPTYTMPVINDCCCTCVTPCVYSRMRIHGAKIFSASLIADLDDDSKCNDPALKSIMEENMTEDTTISKRTIQQAAEEKLSKQFNVICSENDFSYVAYTDTFCQHSNDDITCYAFSPLPKI